MAFSRANAFVTDSTVFALGQPYTSSAPIMKSGAHLGYYLGTRQPMFFDPLQLMRLGLTHSQVIDVYGIKRSGKSTLLKDLILRVPALQAGKKKADESIPYSKVHVNDRKPNRVDDEQDGPLRGEFSPLMGYLLGDHVSLADYGRISIFDPRIDTELGDLIATAVNTAESVAGHPLIGYQSFAIQVAVDRMVSSETSRYSPEQLQWLLHHPDRVSLTTYLDRMDPGDTDIDTTDTGHALTANEDLFQAYVRDSVYVATLFGNLLEGEYGKVFGGTASLYDVLSSDYLNLDWTGVTGKAGDLLESLIYKWRAAALRKGLPIIPDFNISDEEGTRIKSVVHARYFAQYVREARAYPTCTIQATQFSTDRDNLGEEGSELRQLGREIDSGIGVRFYGRQPAKDDILHSITRHGVSDEDAWQTTQLDQGCWGIKLPDRPMQFFQHVVPQEILPIIETDWANKRAATRQRVSDMPHMIERLEQLQQLN